MHPLFLPRDILPRLPERWRTRYANEHSGRGARGRRATTRAGATGASGSTRPCPAVPPGSDIGLIRTQLLEEYDTDIAILIPLTFVLEGPAEYKAALCRAINDWLAQEWLDRDPRLRGSVNVPFDSPDLAVAEIERFADDPRFVQVMVRGDTQSEWGDRKYWPIYSAIEAAGFVAMCHVGGDPGNRYRGSGAPSYYLEQHVWLHMPVERLAMSLICEGVFDAYPQLQVALVEACLPGRAAAVGDGRRLRDGRRRRAAAAQAPVGVLPRALLAQYPADRGTHNPRHLVTSIEFARMTDRVMFSSDYPHWDFDSPAKALPAAMPAGAARQDHGRQRRPPLRPPTRPRLMEQGESVGSVRSKDFKILIPNGPWAPPDGPGEAWVAAGRRWRGRAELRADGNDRGSCRSAGRARAAIAVPAGRPGRVTGLSPGAEQSAEPADGRSKPPPACARRCCCSSLTLFLAASLAPGMANRTPRSGNYQTR